MAETIDAPNKAGRDTNGQFAQGNPGGPGRPRRLVERDYLAGLGNVISADKWARICERAADDALNGDSAARAWLAKYLLGSGSLPSPLFALAVAEEGGNTVQKQIADQLSAMDVLHMADAVWRQIDTPKGKS